jgi:dTDP-4-dehydrorhamnose 3,5-epimerase
MFRTGDIEGVIARPLLRHTDHRGWLVELFREDELDPQYRPVMAYVSMTGEGVARGPHEHADQADAFAFLGPSTFKVYLWDNRPASPSYRVRQVLEVGTSHPMMVIIPPGVVHAYKNIGTELGMVINYPNRLFAGWGRKEPVDEVRHENDPASPFQLD